MAEPSRILRNRARKNSSKEVSDGLSVTGGDAIRAPFRENKEREDIYFLAKAGETVSPRGAGLFSALRREGGRVVPKGSYASWLCTRRKENYAPSETL